MRLPLYQISDFVKYFDPVDPLQPGHPFYVTLDEGVSLRGEQGRRSCIDSLFHRIYLTGENPGISYQLFSGFPGSGKTTELLRLKKRLDEDGSSVPTTTIYIDFKRWIDPHVPPSITDVIRIMAYSLDRYATEAEKKDPDETPGYLDKLLELISNLQIKDLGLDLGPAKLMLQLRNSRSFNQQVQEMLAKRSQHFSDQARISMNTAVARIKTATCTQRIVVIADGLEKFTPFRAEDRSTMEKAVEEMFVAHSSMLCMVPCHVIYTFPLWLRFRVADLGNYFNHAPQILPMVKIVERDSKDYPLGMEKLREVIQRRLTMNGQDYSSTIFGEDYSTVMDFLVRASGGYFRDLLRLIRAILIEFEEFPVSAAQVATVLHGLSEEYGLIIRAVDLDLIAKVATNHRMPIGDADTVANFGDMLQRYLILAYRDNEEWYGVHPLVRALPSVDLLLNGRSKL